MVGRAREGSAGSLARKEACGVAHTAGNALHTEKRTLHASTACTSRAPGGQRIWLGPARRHVDCTGMTTHGEQDKRL